jgi:N-methylhydantoinase A
LRRDLACSAIDRLAARLNFTREATAQGILDISVSNMVQAIRATAAERGIDLRLYTLFAGGGAGPLAAPAIARDLQMRQVLIPRFPGMLSTVGLLLSDLRFDSVQSMPMVLEQADMARIAAALSSMAADNTAKIRRETDDAAVEIRLSLDMRYRRQNWEIAIAVDPANLGAEAVAEAFDAEHERLFGFCNAGQPHEIINLRCVAIGRLSDPADLLARLVPRTPQTPGVPVAQTQIYDEALRRWAPCPVYERETLCRTQAIPGPALIVQADSTIYVPGDASACQDAFGNIILKMRQESLLF